MDTYTVFNVLSAYAVEKNDLDLRRQLNIPPKKLFVDSGLHAKLDKALYNKCNIINMFIVPKYTVDAIHDTIESIFKDFARARSHAMLEGQEENDDWYMKWYVCIYYGILGI